MPENVMSKNKPYDGVRLTILGLISGLTYSHYCEATGNRFYVNEVNSPTASLDAATFNSHLTFTTNDTQSWEFILIPMSTGETLMMETRVSALNVTGTKGYMMSSFGGYRHSGATLSVIGSGISYNKISEFTVASASFITSGSQSINMKVDGESGEIINWDISIDYKKGYHSLIAPPMIRGPWYPGP